MTDVEAVWIKLEDKRDDKLTVFLEIDSVLFNTYIPHPSEGFFTKPNKDPDFFFEHLT